MNGIIRVSAIAMAVLFIATASAIILTDGSDASTTTYNLQYEVGQEVDEDLTALIGKTTVFYSGDVPPGLEVTLEKTGSAWYGSVYTAYLSGTVTASTGSYVFKMTDDSDFYEFHVSIYTGECTVTYDAGIGLVKGNQTWTETITKGSYASLPQATHSSGAYDFVGWAVSATSSAALESYAPTKDVTLHAVWKRNTVQISDAIATITSGQTSVLPMRTVPSDAVLSVSSLGGLGSASVRVSDEGIVLDMEGVEPGTYYVTVSASYTGYITGESVITVKVPITIVKPIEYVLSAGDAFSYTPVTNPTNAEITLSYVTIDGNVVTDHDLSVEGRTINGTLTRTGTYSITYTASLDGYVNVTNTVFVKVNERPITAPAPIMGAITATPRANEPRVYDFVLSGYANASNIIWSYEGRVFATSSSTALFEFPASGSYTVTCTLAGYDGSFVSEDFTVICLDNYHREAAWAGVRYSCIVESDAEVSIQNGAPFSVVTQELNGKTYRMIVGTPSDVYIGESYDVHVGSDSWSVTIYRTETSAPVADFDLVLSDDGYTVVAVFKGQNASFYSYDFDGDGIAEQGNAFTYSKEGRYTVVCKAVNNVSEVSRSEMVSINLIPHEDVDISELTDFEMLVGERLDVILSVDEGVPITVSGSAAGFVTVLDGVLRAEPTEKGVFDLTVSVHNGNQATVSKTIKITVRGTEIQDLEEERHDYMVVMAVFFVISVSAIAVFILRDIRPQQSGYGQGSSIIKRFQRRRQYR